MTPEKNLHVRLQQSEPIPLNVDFTCDKNEIFVIVGPSGSGKTTILRSICGLYHATSGKISCNGQDWIDTEKNLSIPVQQRRIGMMFQHYALFPHLTAQQNIILAYGHIEKSKRATRARELLSLVNMQGLEARYPHELSGGQQQRVALARALAREPNVLLLDEPFSSVDQQTRRKLLRELVRIRHQFNMPIILVTHDLDEARMLADKMCVIHHGQTLQTAPPAIIMTKPVSAVVARLVGLDNVFAGTIEQHDTETQTTIIRWHEYRLTTPYRPEFEIDSEIDWVIPSENLILHRRDRPSKGERENPIKGSIKEFIPLGENSSILISVNDHQQSLSMSVPTHVARRNRLDTGGEVSVSLLTEGIHLMEK